jgi:hypothetical protein
MKRILEIAIAACVALGAAPAFGAAAALVDGVQMPAWVERNVVGNVQRTPLAAGMELKAGDTLKTGAGARVYVKLAEGSLVQLGENASLQLQELQPQKDGIFKAALNMLEGAFRFTTEAVAKKRRREVTIAVRTVTAGIRGTDLWGRSTEERQIVCLIEGAIEVGAQGEQAVKMDQPLQFYQREKGKTAPVGFVSAGQLKQWAAETAIEKGRGAARRGGAWTVTLASADNQAAALAVYDQLRVNGYAAEIRPEKAEKGTVYHVRIGGLPSKADAEALASQLRGKMGVTEPKVSM